MHVSVEGGAGVESAETWQKANNNQAETEQTKQTYTCTVEMYWFNC